MGLSLWKSLLLYLIFTVCAILGATYFVWTAPPLPPSHCAEICTPIDVIRGRLVREPRKSILGWWTCLREYKKNHWWYATGGIWGAYVVFDFLGPLGPGSSLVLSVLIGALYDEWTEPSMRYSLMAHLLGISGELCGGVGGWMMSYAIGREILLHCAPGKMATLQTKMDMFQGSMLRYMLFLRVSPLFPNWFVNYSTALIGMPFAYFITATFLAIQPVTIMSISFGHMLRDAGETGLDLQEIGKRVCIMAIAMLWLSLAFIPVHDYRNGFAKFKAGLNRSPCCRKHKDPLIIADDTEMPSVLTAA